MDYCSIHKGHKHIININVSIQMSMVQLQTLSVFEYYSCPSLDKAPISFDLWYLEITHKTAWSCFELCSSWWGCRMNKQSDEGPSIGQEKRMRSTLVLLGRHLIATKHLIINKSAKFVWRLMYLNGQAAHENNVVCTMGTQDGTFCGYRQSKMWSCLNSMSWGKHYACIEGVK